MPVKVFVTNSKLNNLDDMINEWEEKENIKIIDIDYAISGIKLSEYTTTFIHGAIIIYEIKKDDPKYREI